MISCFELELLYGNLFVAEKGAVSRISRYLKACVEGCTNITCIICMLCCMLAILFEIMWIRTIGELVYVCRTSLPIG